MSFSRTGRELLRGHCVWSLNVIHFYMLALSGSTACPRSLNNCHIVTYFTSNCLLNNKRQRNSSAVLVAHYHAAANFAGIQIPMAGINLGSCLPEATVRVTVTALMFGGTGGSQATCRYWWRRSDPPAPATVPPAGTHSRTPIVPIYHSSTTFGRQIGRPNTPLVIYSHEILFQLTALLPKCRHAITVIFQLDEIFPVELGDSLARLTHLTFGS